MSKAEITEIPAVGKNFYVMCKKCETDRYHIVLAHKSSRSAKIKCEVCGSQKSFSLPKVQERKSSKPAGSKAPTSRKVVSEESRRSQHHAEYENLLKQHDATPTQKYSMKSKFELNHKVDHPKFGLGLIRNVQIEKIEVVFADEVRVLVHNRQ